MRNLRFALLLLIPFIGGAASATTLTLPGANPMSAGQYNSFSVYSLDLLDQCAAAGDPRYLPAGPLPVAASPGQIAGDAIVLTSANGMSNFTSPFAAGSKVDDVFLTPTGQQSNTYNMNGNAGGKFAGDLANRWDISLDVLQNYLGGHDLVFLFDNNQAGNGTSQFLNIWGQARIVDTLGNTVMCFEISTANAGCANVGPDPVPAMADFLPAVSDFCVDKVSGVAYNIGLAKNAQDCPAMVGHAQGGYQVNNNVSTSVAEFAAFNQSLNDAVANPLNSQYFLSLNIQYTGNGAGAEQLWICKSCDVSTASAVPEPSTAVLLLGAVLAFGLYQRTTRKS